MGLELLGDLVEHRLALVQRLVEAVLLGFEVDLASLEVYGELGVHVLVLLAYHLGQLHREAGGDPEEAAVAP